MTVTVTMSGDGISFEREVDESTALEIMEVAISDGAGAVGEDARPESGEGDGDGDETAALPDDFFDRLTTRQRAFVEILHDAEEWVTNEEIRQRMAEEYDLATGGSQGISGIRSGFTRKYGGDFDLVESNWLGSQNEYRINPAYLDELGDGLQ